MKINLNAHCYSNKEYGGDKCISLDENNGFNAAAPKEGPVKGGTTCE